jgi:hypothetical protein
MTQTREHQVKAGIARARWHALGRRNNPGVGEAQIRDAIARLGLEVVGYEVEEVNEAGQHFWIDAVVHIPGGLCYIDYGGPVIRRGTNKIQRERWRRRAELLKEEYLLVRGASTDEIEWEIRYHMKARERHGNS